MTYHLSLITAIYSDTLGKLFLRLLPAFGWLVILLGMPVKSQAFAAPDSSIVKKDSSVVELRHFDSARLESYRKDKEFAYDRARTPDTLSAWDRFLMWLWDKLFRFVFTKKTATFWRWSLYIICALVICYVILKLSRTNLSSFFGRSALQQMPDSLSEDENIHELDFNQLIAEAINRQNYRRAVRLYYLQSLKQLTDRHLIDWKINKTNHDYLLELRRNQPDSALATTFRRLTSLFEYICYGNFAVGLNEFEQVRGTFQQFSQDIINAKKRV
jgi:hypothetical protein